MGPIVKLDYIFSRTVSKCKWSLCGILYTMCFKDRRKMESFSQRKIIQQNIFTVMYKKQCQVTCSLYRERSVGGGDREGWQEHDQDGRPSFKLALWGWFISKGCPWEVCGENLWESSGFAWHMCHTEELRGWVFCPSQTHRGAVSLLTFVITMRQGQKEQWS